MEIVALTRKHLFLFWLIVCLPLVVISGLGWRLARQEQRMGRQRLQDLLFFIKFEQQWVEGDEANRAHSLSENLVGDKAGLRA